MLNISQYQQHQTRICGECGQNYTIDQYLSSSPQYFERPWSYRAGCGTYCLACWLGVESPTGHAQQQEGSNQIELIEIVSSQDLQVEGSGNWPYEEFYEPLMDGELLAGFQCFLDDGANLAVMPVARMIVERTILFPDAIAFYPPGEAKLDSLNLIPNRENTNSLSEKCSAASGVTLEILKQHPLVVFPCRFDWQAHRRSNHNLHLEFIRWLSAEVDRACLNFVRYRSCRLGTVDDLPAHAGQLASNPMMAGVLLYSTANREARITGGAAFTHYLTRGFGLPLNQLEWSEFPQDGEVGKIVNHALSLYTGLLETEDSTACFTQALSLLEFLAYPDEEYRNFKKTKRIVARYAARDANQYQRILDRLLTFTGERDPDSNNIVGYRTRVVHLGDRIERIVPQPRDRRQIFLELDEYIRCIIDHMILHSTMAFEEYQKERDSLRPFEI